MEKVITHNLINHSCYLSNTFIECRSLFMTHFNRIPSIAYVGEMEDGKALEAFMDKYEELIARYEFGKLNVEKAQRLSNHFGFDKTITKPMTLAEISNPNEKGEPTTEVIGFRRQNACLAADRN